jgi:hypothetical protein
VVFVLGGLPKDDMERRSMNKAKIWFMNARVRRFLESTAIKGVQILERSGWLDNLRGHSAGLGAIDKINAPCPESTHACVSKRHFDMQARTMEI